MPERALRPPLGRLVRVGRDGPAGRVVPPPLARALEDAARVRADLADARVRAERELARLREQARRAGRDEGFSAGLVAGRAQAQAEAGELRERALAEATEIRGRALAEADRVLGALRGGALALARRMAEKIVGRAIALDASLLADLAAQALAEARARQGALTLRVHPEQLAALEAQRPRLHAALAEAVRVALVPDPEVGRDGCVVESADGRVDARLGAQLDALERALTEARAHEG